MEDISRIPPHSVESEQSILGSILLDKDAIITVSETINPDDFYKEAHKIIYEAMIKLSNKSEPIDLITLTEELKKQGHLEIGRASCRERAEKTGGRVAIEEK